MSVRIERKASPRLSLIPVLLALLAADQISAGQEAKPATNAAIAPGPFTPDWDSLKQYECPEWFRDAKFGIWAHWSAQCVPEQGDWYAQKMYQEKDPDYKYHVEHYGHPPKVGFKDICNLWKAEKWDPDRLMQLYKRAGAKYFVALANHHCNFDCWDSKYQPWNSVDVGPKKDIVGTWAEVARRNGLRFGVTVHCARSWEWYEVAHGSDSEGPLKGVPYDGALTKADGKGQWWDGLDPADLYCPHGAARTPEAHQAYVVKFFNRTKDLIDKYQPDLLYFDDGNLPLGEAGMNIAAHFYNANMQWHDNKLEAVLNIKGPPPGCRPAVVLDRERGRSDRLEDLPWQTDTCIGEWHYHRGITYASARDIIHQLVDIVSKNGNLLLNIPVRGDGSIDDEEIKFLEEMAAWMDVNSEAIYGTRPWKIAGEGRPRKTAYTANDLRFTTKGGALYAFALGWPDDGKLTVRSLANPNTVTEVALLGHSGKLEWTQDENGLTVALPSEKPCEYAIALRINGQNLEPIQAAIPPEIVQPGPDGSLTLSADTVELHGDRVQVEETGGKPNVGFWDNAGDWLSWNASFPKSGTFDVSVVYSAANGSTEFVVEAAGQQLPAKVAQTQSWGDFQMLHIGKIEIQQAGQQIIKVRPREANTWKAINLRYISLKIS